jgi:hypothetical protein
MVCGVHPPFYPMRIRGFLPEIEWAGCEAYHLQLLVEVAYGAIHLISMVWYLIKPEYKNT